MEYVDYEKIIFSTINIKKVNLLQINWNLVYWFLVQILKIISFAKLVPKYPCWVQRKGKRWQYKVGMQIINILF